jgi:hypothetical protein
LTSQEEFKTRMDEIGNWFVIASIIAYIVGLLGVVFLDQVFQFLAVLVNPILLGIGFSLKNWLDWNIGADISRPLESFGRRIVEAFSQKMVLLTLLAIFGLIVEAVLLGFFAVGVFVLLPIIGGIIVIIQIILFSVFLLVCFGLSFFIGWRVFNYALKPQLREIKATILYQKSQV